MRTRIAKVRLGLIASAAIGIVLGVSAVPAHAAPVFQTGFESPYHTGNLGGQQGWTVIVSPEDFTVQTSVVQSGTQAIKVAATGGSGVTLRADSDPLAPPALVASGQIITYSYGLFLNTGWSASMPTNTIRDAGLEFTVNDGTKGLYILPEKTSGIFGTFTGWEFGANDSTNMQVAATLATLENSWVNLKLVANNGTGIAEAFVNNSSLGTVSFTPGSITSLKLAEAQGASTVQATYLDNLSVSVVPLPEATWMALPLMGLMGVVYFRRRNVAQA